MGILKQVRLLQHGNKSQFEIYSTKYMGYEKMPGRIALTPNQLNQLIEEIEKSSLQPKTKQLLCDSLRALVWVQRTLEQKTLTIRELLRVFFGRKTETAKNVLPENKSANQDKDNKDSEKSTDTPPASVDKKRGHGK